MIIKSLKKKPLYLINNLQLTNCNFKIAFDLLNQRYDNKLNNEEVESSKNSLDLANQFDTNNLHCQSNEIKPKIDTTTLHTVFYCEIIQIILTSASVLIVSSHGNFIAAKALLDNRSQVSTISQHLYTKQKKFHLLKIYAFLMFHKSLHFQTLW